MTILYNLPAVRELFLVHRYPPVLFAAYNNYPEELDILLGNNEFADPNICGGANETVRAKISLQFLQKRIIISLSLSLSLDLVDCTNNTHPSHLAASNAGRTRRIHECRGRIAKARRGCRQGCVSGLSVNYWKENARCHLDFLRRISPLRYGQWNFAAIRGRTGGLFECGATIVWRQGTSS